MHHYFIWANIGTPFVYNKFCWKVIRRSSTVPHDNVLHPIAKVFRNVFSFMKKLRFMSVLKIMHHTVGCNVLRVVGAVRLCVNILLCFWLEYWIVYDNFFAPFALIRGTHFDCLGAFGCRGIFLFGVDWLWHIQGLSSRDVVTYSATAHFENARVEAPFTRFECGAWHFLIGRLISLFVIESS